MAVIPAVEEDHIAIQKFIDWDKCRNTFYNNMYLDNWKIVIKMPLIPREDSEDNFKIKKFDLEKYIFLCSY